MKQPVYNEEWSDLVKALYQHDMQEIWDPSILPHMYNYYHAELARYLKIAGEESLRILDVGCAQGTLALLLAEAGHRVTAVDLRSEFLEYAQSRYEFGEIEFLQRNALELNSTENYDLIFANQILEHLVHPVDLVGGLTRLLRRGGRVVATTPNRDYIRSHLPSFSELGDVSKYEDRQFFPDGDAHFFAYTAGELEHVFAQAGLRCIRVVPYASPWISGHMKFRFLHGKVPRSVLSWMDRMTLGIPGGRWKAGYQLMGIGEVAG